MKYLLKNILRPIYYYLKDKNQRELYRLQGKWGKYQKYEAVNNVKFLKTNLSKNGINGIEIIDSAVWIDNNGINFGQEGSDSGSIKNGENITKVKSVRLREFIESEDIIDMLKIDVEGAEHEILIDCQNCLDRVQNLFVEYHSWNQNQQKLSEILNILEKNGFRYYLENLTSRKHPLINTGLNETMDLQVNIFATRR